MLSLWDEVAGRPVYYTSLVSQTIVIVGTLWRGAKEIAKRLDVSLSQRITDNVNRGMAENREYIDEKFRTHEVNAFARITDLDQAVKEHIKICNERSKDG